MRKYLINSKGVYTTWTDGDVEDGQGYSLIDPGDVPDGMVKVLRAGAWSTEPEEDYADSTMSREELLTQRDAEINTVTDNIISQGFDFTLPNVIQMSDNGNYEELAVFHAPGDIITQSNYHAAFSTLDYTEMPTKFWNGTISVTFKTKIDLTNFLLQYFKVIKAVLAEGEALRNSLRNLSYEKILAFEDPRVV